jgi:hypothetical protein
MKSFSIPTIIPESWPPETAIVRAFALLSLLAGTAPAVAQVGFGHSYIGPDRYAQVLLGSQRVDQSWFLHEDQGSFQRMDVRSIHSLGYFAQLPVEDGWYQYGIEWGGHLGYDSRRSLVVALSGDESFIRINSRLWTGDFSAGGFVSIRPVDGLRFYASAGPLVNWAQLRRRDDYAQSQLNNDAVTSGSYVIDTRRYRYDLGAAFYGRVGVELMPVPGFTIGLSARRTTTELDFGQSGYVDLGRVNYMLTLGGTF